jgi:ElaB protein
MGASIDADEQVNARDFAQDALKDKFSELFEGVEDLIKRVGDVESPEIQKIRAKARVALMMAKSAVQDGAVHVGRRARHAAGTTDDYLREYPWYALGVGTLLGFGLGVLVARSR